MDNHGWKLDIGASIVADGVVRFRVWAPEAGTVGVRVSTRASLSVALKRTQWGYFEGEAENVHAEDQYFYIINNEKERPDPASRFQPDGVHGPSQIVDPRAFTWHDDQWTGILLDGYVIYELHVGTFTDMGRFESIIEHLDYLADFGITAIELMPVAQFPGERNWGYDGVYPFAPQNSYGVPTGLKKLVDACHDRGLSVILDVVYNHIGPEGNYFEDFSPWYFTDNYKTPWGKAINFDGPHCDQVRDYFIDNALYWITEYHVDALRIDAIHGIFDFSAQPFLKQLTEAVHRQGAVLGRNVYIMAESDLNDVRIICPPDQGGYGFDAQWNDDFHHALHVLITGEQQGYYEDFGLPDQISKAFSDGFVYSGQYSQFRKRKHGSSSKGRSGSQFIVCVQNHDQTANSLDSRRLSRTQSLEKLKLAAGVVLLSPYLPLLFMGEEYGEKAPFHYFTSHSDQTLAEAVRVGRQSEFAGPGWEDHVKDPQNEETFLESKIRLLSDKSEEQKTLFTFYRELLRLRKISQVLRNLSKEHMKVKSLDGQQVILVHRWYGEEELICLFNFSKEKQFIPGIPPGQWALVIDSSSEMWGGTGSSAPDTICRDNPTQPVSVNPFSVAVYFRKVGVRA